jgi:deoxyribodipyrimidine photo-lyase
MAVFIFRRDLRIIDNTAFGACVQWAQENNAKVYPIFIFSEQIDRLKNKYFSNAAVQFMCESLEDLAGALKEQGGQLHMFEGNNIDILGMLKRKCELRAIFFNSDYSVYAKNRDSEIDKWCKSNHIECHAFEDYDLIPLSEGLLPDGRPYTNLSQYFAKFQKGLVNVRKPEVSQAAELGKLRKVDVMKIAALGKFYTRTPDLAQKGGRRQGLEILKRLKQKQFGEYATQRDYPARDATTKSSAHLHFGTVSVREMYHLAPEALRRELVFRSFYLKIYSMKPELQRGQAFREDLDGEIPWRGIGDPTWKPWTTGTTGFPMVDAGMRQLASTGWMHNRVRMLVATTATRYFMLDWRLCARFFYSQLVDADTFSNTAGWQWSAGIGPDAAPYFRAPLNPFIQSKKFDADAEYIRKWVPELKDVAAADIHKWDNPKVRAKYPLCSYMAPIVDQKEASARATLTFKAAMQKLRAEPFVTDLKTA